MRSFINREKYIIHACGVIQGGDGEYYSYTNSKEALVNCYSKGNKISEVDFLLSSDNYLVCTHGWDLMYKNGIKQDNKAMTKEEFLNCKTNGGFTSMWLGDLIDFLQEHPDFYFVTDIKDENVKACGILNSYIPPEYKDHFIIQIYHESEYDEIYSMGFNYIIYTLYSTFPEERQVGRLLSFAKEHKLLAFTYWANWTGLYLNEFLETGIPSYVHTVNDVTQRIEYFNVGIDAIYTDIVDN
ncbi:MAG: hypothetical protein J5631_00185 [Spirochaetaceae bacterium]|nr:hypothetical protein [Spirochaetaceae bacterium]